MTVSPLSNLLFDVDTLAEGLQIAQKQRKKRRAEPELKIKRPTKSEERRAEEKHKKDKFTRQFLHVIHKPTYCVTKWHNCYDEPIPHARHSLSAFKSKTETFSGLAVSRMKTALNWLYLFADKKRVHSKAPWVNKNGKICHDFTFRLAFITLTLSGKQKHTDEHIKEKMLKPFLHWIQRSYKASYVWKAEAQLNGNIHFHITIDTFIHWKSVRAKWNGLLASQGYSKCFQDGSNDKGDAATQIKAIRNEKGHAGIVGGYLTKGSIEEKEHYRLKNKLVTIDELLQGSEGVSCNIETKKHYSRFIDGRLWSQSQSLSNINVEFDEFDPDFKATEKSFFHDNDLKNLGTVLFKEAKEKHKGKTESERIVLGYDDVSLKKKFCKFHNVFVHKNLKSLRIPDKISKLIADEKANRSLNTQRSFTVESLF